MSNEWWRGVAVSLLPSGKPVSRWSAAAVRFSKFLLSSHRGTKTQRIGFIIIFIEAPPVAVLQIFRVFRATIFQKLVLLTKFFYQYV